jgi:DNA-binding MarR family transcriptional regulator
MSQILNKMKTMGFIKRTPSKEDGRKVYITLTSAGRKIVVKYKYEKDEWLKTVIEKSLSDKEKEILTRALPVLKKLAEIKQEKKI